jgi:hypothetical protein
MSIRSWRYTIWHFLGDAYYFARTGDDWFEVRHGIWRIWHETTAPARAIGQFFARIWKFRSILWNDFDWDHGYLLALMEFKFLNMMKYHRDNGHLMDNPTIAHELRECSEICRRVHSDNYCEAEHAAHEAKWGKSELTHTPAQEYGVDKLGKPKMFELHVVNPNATTPELKEQERKEQLAIFDLERQRKQADIDRLAELIRTRLENWWD